MKSLSSICLSYTHKVNYQAFNFTKCHSNSQHYAANTENGTVLTHKLTLGVMLINTLFWWKTFQHWIKHRTWNHVYKRDNLCKSGYCWIHTGANRGYEEEYTSLSSPEASSKALKIRYAQIKHHRKTEEWDFPDIDDRNSNSTLINASVTTSLLMNTPHRERGGNWMSLWATKVTPWWGLNMDKKNMNCKTEIYKSKFQWYKIVNNTAKFSQFFLFSVHWNRWLSFCIKTARDQTKAVRYRY